jgi:hypothetical protein
LSGGQHGGVTIRITSSDASKLKLAPNESTVGGDYVDLTFANGEASK